MLTIVHDAQLMLIMMNLSSCTLSGTTAAKSCMIRQANSSLTYLHHSQMKTLSKLDMNFFKSAAGDYSTMEGIHGWFTHYSTMEINKG